MQPPRRSRTKSFPSIWLRHSSSPRLLPLTFARGGRIINLSSALTRIAAPTRPVYAASKGAINALTLALAAELGPRGTTVNAVAPGVIDTDMNSGWLNEPEARRQAEALSVFSRVGSADDVAGLVAFLASHDGRWTTSCRLPRVIFHRSSLDDSVRPSRHPRPYRPTSALRSSAGHAMAARSIISDARPTAAVLDSDTTRCSIATAQASLAGQRLRLKQSYDLVVLLLRQRELHRLRMALALFEAGEIQHFVEDR